MPPTSQAEAYASAHHPHPKKDNKRELLGWLSRKLGTGNRRATIPGELGSPHHPTQHETEQAKLHQTRVRNNPYPSMALQRPISAVQSSFMSRSDSQLSRQTEMDDNASTKPIPPSHPASPSHSNALSRTPSNAASVSLLSPSVSLMSPRPPKRDSTSDASLSTKSTKPTTMSYDSSPQMGHIAQAPLGRNLPHSNPHPSDPPAANASTFTLAGSTINPSGSTATLASSTLPMQPTRRPLAGGAGVAGSPSVTFAPDTGDKSSLIAPSGLSGKMGMDKDASVRAVRRKGSDDSMHSKWSWKAVEPRVLAIDNRGMGAETRGMGMENRGMGVEMRDLGIVV